MFQIKRNDFVFYSTVSSQCDPTLNVLRILRSSCCQVTLLVT